MKRRRRWAFPLTWVDKETGQRMWRESRSPFAASTIALPFSLAEAVFAAGGLLFALFALLTGHVPEWLGTAAIIPCGIVLLADLVYFVRQLWIEFLLWLGDDVL